MTNRIPRLSSVGDALTTAILQTPYADPSDNAFETYPEFTREQVILAGACYYYAGAGSLLMMARAKAMRWPNNYSIVAGQLQMDAVTPEGDTVYLTVGTVGKYDPLDVEAGNMHAWIQLHDKNTYHIIDFTSRNWKFHAISKHFAPATYPDFVHMTYSDAPPAFTNVPFSLIPDAAITEHMRSRLRTPEGSDVGFDPAVVDIAVRAARYLSWDTSMLRKLPVRKSSSVDIPAIRVVTVTQVEAA